MIAPYKEILPDDCTVNSLAIIYQNDDGVLVLMCNISDQVVTVYTSCQQFIETDNIITYTFEDILTASVKFPFSEPIEGSMTSQ